MSGWVGIEKGNSSATQRCSYVVFLPDVQYVRQVTGEEYCAFYMFLTVCVTFSDISLSLSFLLI